MQAQGRAGKVVRALCVPYSAATQGLSRLTPVNGNCCSMALSWLCHVVPKLWTSICFVAGCRATRRSIVSSVADISYLCLLRVSADAQPRMGCALG